MTLGVLGPLWSSSYPLGEALLSDVPLSGLKTKLHVWVSVVETAIRLKVTVTTPSL